MIVSLKISLLVLLLLVTSTVFHQNHVLVNGLTIAVFGGSGYLGRRVSQTLVDAGCDVISISRSGKPPSYYCNTDKSNSGVNTNESDDVDGRTKGVSSSQNWSDLVKWVSYDVENESTNSNSKVVQEEGEGGGNDKYKLPKIDAAISCIGNVQPDPQYLKSSFFGLAFNEERLFYENGVLNENAIRMAKDAGAKRFVFLSVSYEVSKMLEGPIPGYINGKRKAEHLTYSLFGENDDAIVIGPSLMYGGKRFDKFGGLYRKFIESFFAQSYVNFNDFLRNLSSAPLEDWVEKVIFSPPVKVDVVARVASAAALGYVKRDMVGDRRQGFYNTDGKPVLYDNVIFVDGTKELEKVDEILKPKLSETKLKNKEEGRKMEVSSAPNRRTDEEKEPSFEGALIGKGPFLFPLPIALFFLSIFYNVANGQYVIRSN